ncbi:MAG: 2,3-bisphosphoglycerate-independent phosphoglycerate mutase [Endozoicomonadaceae bacterium]|nr:2,3-bisphosphoglycerate-independent phosphoglycerate mutase [Endozoicomonadaceae bacterium]MBE8233250.1 2,3-bisphosphoglycerate-independent phosphoglycerate mutase [Endozoicomonadaceae bacterium]
MSTKPTALIILDGWGHRNAQEHNAIKLANTPTFDQLWDQHPHTLLHASSEEVGLPEGQMGNSEVGHMSIGSGRIIHQELTQINNDIKKNKFHLNPILNDTIDQAIQHNRAIHLIGLLSPGGIHAHEMHFQALIEMAAVRGAKKIYIHAFLDGRDTPPQSALSSIQRIDDQLHALKVGHIASIIGRYYAMDRDTRWDRTHCAYHLIRTGTALFTAPDAATGLQLAYERNETDEFVQATRIQSEHHSPQIIEAEDAVFFMNFRSDRARQLTEALTDPTFNSFERSTQDTLKNMVTLTPYADYLTHVKWVYPAKKILNSLGEMIANTGQKQFRIAETEKYAHVTFFFNGGQETPFLNETRCLVQSPQVDTYDLTPDMSAVEVTQKLVKAIHEKKYALLVCNYANADMVGHTGNLEATIQAIERLDTSLKEILIALQETQGQCLITADHGNAEIMQDIETGNPHTAHSCASVPCIYFGSQPITFKKEGKLCDIAPTLLTLMQIPIPKEMTGQSLLSS